MAGELRFGEYCVISDADAAKLGGMCMIKFPFLTPPDMEVAVPVTVLEDAHIAVRQDEGLIAVVNKVARRPEDIQPDRFQSLEQFK